MGVGRGSRPFAIRMVGAFVLAVMVVAALAGCSVFGVFTTFDSYDNASEYAAGPADLPGTVERVVIDWGPGSVTVGYQEGSEVSVSEESDFSLDDESSLHYWLDGTTLRIHYCASGVTLTGNLNKRLTVMLPRGTSLSGIEVNADACDLAVSDVACEDLDVSANAGDIELTGVSATGTVGIAVNAGDIDLTDVEASDVSVEADAGDVVVSMPDVLLGGLSVECNAGDVEIDAPSDASFAIVLDDEDAGLESDLPFTRHGSVCTFGSGSAAPEYQVSIAVGDLTVGEAA